MSGNGGYEGLGFTRWESSGALGDPSPRRRGHSGEKITGAREAPVEEGKEMGSLAVLRLARLASLAGVEGSQRCSK